MRNLILVELTCEYCGNSFSRQPSRLKYGRGKHCSPACQYAAIRERPKTQVERSCLNCNNAFFVPPSLLKTTRGAGKYCCRACRDIHRNGMNHPQYINGSAQEHRGPNWQAQKRRAKRRDKWKCRKCGKTHKQCVEEYGQTLHVHHIRPYRLFASYLEANALPNLITLCAPCHRVADADCQRTESEQPSFRF